MIETVGLYGSFVLAAVGILGIFLAGSGRTLGWAIGIGSQALWFAFGLVTGQYGFLLTAIGYGAVYVRNWLKWRREERSKLCALPGCPRPRRGPARGEQWCSLHLPARAREYAGPGEADIADAR